MKDKELKRIPYKSWSNSQYSIARFYWGIQVNSDYFEYDRKVVEQMHKDYDNWWSDDQLYKPDLVLYENVRIIKPLKIKRIKKAIVSNTLPF